MVHGVQWIVELTRSLVEMDLLQERGATTFLLRNRFQYSYSTYFVA